MNPKGGHKKPFVIIVPILDHRDGHYVKPNNVAFKYPNFKKNVDPNVHVRVFNFVIKQMQRLWKNISSMHLAITSRKMPFLNQNVLDCMSFATTLQLGFFN